MKNNIVGLRELRENLETYVSAVNKGRSFVVVRRSKPVFKISPPSDGQEMWEEIIDFTKIKKGGVNMSDLISRL